MIRHEANRVPVRRAARVLAACALALAGAAASAAEDAGTRYARMLADTESYARHNSEVERQLGSQREQIASIEAQAMQLDATGADVVALVTRMFESLQQFVAQDLPFKDPISDRQARIDMLRDLMADEGTPLAEKYRRLLEAYAIEIEYGRTIDSYTGKTDDGRDAEYVRVGRVALLYRTTDGAESGYWDRDAGKWVVDNDYEPDVAMALRIARKEVAPDVLEIPVPVAKEVGS